MPESMTGFGSAVTKDNSFSIAVEVRSLNSKGLDISIKGSREVTPSAEREIRHLITQNFQRGNFLVYVRFEYLRLEVAFDLKGVKKILDDYRKTFNALGISPSDDKLLDLILRLHTPVMDEKKIKKNTLSAAKRAIKELKMERIIEGRNLVKEINIRLKAIESHLKDIEKKKPILIKEMKERLSQKIRELAGEDTERAWMEASILADKSDVREEVVRFRSHIERFKEILKEREPLGKKLDFLCQEMHREVNTMATKLPALSEVVVDAKSEIEKIRQQLHNME